MNKLISCELNIDTACVELKFADGSMISIDCTAVEDEVAKNMYQRSEALRKLIALRVSEIVNNRITARNEMQDLSERIIMR